MENTLSDVELARLPDPEQHETLSALAVGGLSVFLGQPVVADVDRIVTAVDWGDGSPTIAAQPDVPRNLTVALTDANTSITGGLMVIVGEDAVGRAVTESLTVSEAVAGWTGTKIFAKVNSITISGTTGTVGAGADQYTVGVGNVIGVPVDMDDSDEVVHAYLGGARVASIDAIATGESTSGIDVNSATYDGSKIMWALIKPNKVV